MDIRPVASEDRTLGGADYFVLWAGVAISLAEIWAGGFLAPLGFGLAMAAIILGHVIGNTLMALSGVIGSDHGISAMVSVRPAFGIKGSNFAAVLNVVQLVCWASIMLIIGGRAGAILGAPFGGLWASSRFWILCIGAATLAWALHTGSPVWRKLQHVTVAGLVAVIGILTWQTVKTFAAAAPTPDAPTSMPFMVGLDLVIAMPISWMPLVSDYSRFSRPGARAFGATWWGYFLVSSWMFALGLMATLVTGTTEPHIQMLTLLGTAGLALPALLLIVFSTVTSDFPDLYSATCSMLNISERVSARTFLWGTGVVSIVVAMVFPMERYESFLYFVGAMFVPLFAIVLTDYFLIRRRALSVVAMDEANGPYWYDNGIHRLALVCWAAGFATYKLFESQASWAGSTLPSVAVSGLLYYALASKRVRDAL